MNPDSRQPLRGSKALMDVFTQFFIVFKLAKVYEPNNANFRERFDEMNESFQRMLEDTRELGIQIRSESIFMNWMPLKFDVSAYPLFRFIRNEFMVRKIGALLFLRGVTSEELCRFMIFLARTEIPKESVFEQFNAQFEAAAFPHISLEKTADAEAEESTHKQASSVFFLGIYHLKQLFGDQKGAWNFSLTKRWTQSIFDLMTLDESFLFGLINIKNFEEYVLNHSVNVCILSLALGRRLGLTRPELVELGISASLHDVGKLDIPKEILDKPTKLDDHEREVIEGHSHAGANRLIQLMMLHELPIPTVQVALEHHITADLGGYPKYLRRKRQTLYSQIVKITDYYDAITTKRVYRPKTFTPAEALALMRKARGSEFVPLLFDVFYRMVGRYPVGSLVVLSTGEVGIVFENNSQPGLGERPQVKLIADIGGNKIDGPVVDLTEAGDGPKTFRRTIIKTLDPDTYGIRIADYFLARAQT